MFAYRETDVYAMTNLPTTYYLFSTDKKLLNQIYDHNKIMIRFINLKLFTIYKKNGGVVS